jgi:hypothetical protein
MSNEETSLEDVFGAVISSYSRAQGIEDGVLVDVSEWARQDGFRLPVAVTTGVWKLICPWDDGRNELDMPPAGSILRAHGQTSRARARDVFDMLKLAIKVGSEGSDRVHFKVAFVSEANGRPATAELWSLCGPGDHAEPVITIMLRGED